MKRHLSELSLIHISAQTSSDKYVLIDGCFFNGMPPGIRTDEGAQMIMLTDEEGHTLSLIHI